jgi:hypothetical protein
MRGLRAIAALLGLAAGGCYHYTFQSAGPAAEPAVTYRVHRATYLNGFVGNGRVDTRQYCTNPIKTELRVTASDVAVAAATLLIVTPHTLYVTCPVAQEAQAPRPRL